ncbi:MAG: (d)CMP kinase [Anaerolineae bacterium]|nr:(d)CMP kinase [Anaerolineae bacterium]
MSKPATIAIDGFAGSGKSTAAARLAEALGYLYFDTGVMYRAVTWAILEQGIDSGDTERVSEVAEALIIDVVANGPDDGRQFTVLADDEDITWAIREPAVEANVSLVSSYPRVRTVLTEQQRRIAAAGPVVMAGRDVGTVVLPQADLKIFLEASAEERARRRCKQLAEQNKPADYGRILAAIIERDKKDRENPVSPTIPADDAVILSTDNLKVDEVVGELQTLVEQLANGLKIV